MSTRTTTPATERSLHRRTRPRARRSLSSHLPGAAKRLRTASVAVASGHFQARADIGSWELDSWELSRVPIRRLRSEMRLNARSVHQIQPTAAITPPIAPPTSDAGRHVQRERGRPNRIHPPRSQPVHHQPRVTQRTADAQHASDDGEQETFLQEQPTHLRRTEADRPEQTNLAHALLDSQLEEQRHEQQGRDHDKEAEVDELLAKSVAPREASRP